ncbi:MAG: DUF1841 family protein [Candidatus Binataceae bacterium]
MKAYDALVDPEPDEWLSTDEGARIEWVRKYHLKARARMPNLQLHSMIHVVVENQLAMKIPAVRSALNRMLAQGLDRHDAIHAIGSVLAEQMHDLWNSSISDGDPNDAYYRALEELTAEKWRNPA